MPSMTRALAFALGLVLATSCAHSNPAPSPAREAEGAAAPPEAPPPEAQAEREPLPSREEAEAQFAELVRRARAGDAVDFRALRRAWLFGPAMKPDPRREKLPELRKAMFEEMREGGDHAVVLAKAREILDIEYVDLWAQKAQRQACQALGDEPCAQRGRVTALGLLKSVVDGGDGTSCATAWRVISIDEEYFVLSMIDAEFKRQQVVSEDGNTCDAMLVDHEGEEKTFYFEITDVLMARARQLGRIK